MAAASDEPLEIPRTPPDGVHREGDSAGQSRFRATVRGVRELRAQVRSTPGGRAALRTVVSVVGVTVIVVGLVLVPLPGPGWLIVFLGLTVLASEFVWARRLRDHGRHLLKRWTHWILERPWWVRLSVSTLTGLFVVSVVYLFVLWQGIPSWLPGWVVPPLPGL